MLKKDIYNVEIVDIYIEFSEWLLRNQYDNELIKDYLLSAADLLIQIEIDDD